jgi:hypothetical protein
MERPARYLTADDEIPDEQLVSDAADDVSAGRAHGEVATLDPMAAPAVEDELLEDALDAMPGHQGDDLTGPDDDDIEAWLDEGSAG